MDYWVGTERLRTQKIVDILSKITEFDSSEIRRLMEIFDDLTTSKLDRRKFMKFIFENFDIDDELLLDRIFKVTTTSKELKVDIVEFITCLSIMIRGPDDLRIKFCFDVYNLSKEKFIGKFDIVQLLKNSILNAPPNVEFDDFLKELMEITISKFTKSENQKIFLEDFTKAIKEQPILLQCLGIVFPAPKKIEAFETFYFFNLSH